MHSEFFDGLKGQVLDDDMIKKIQAESGKDVTDAKTKMQAQIDSLTGQVTELQTQVSQRDTDLSQLKEKLTQAGQSATKLTEVQKNLDELTEKYNQETSSYKAQLEKQQYDFLAKETMSGVKFSSNAAKENFYRKLIEKNLPIENQRLLGFAEYLEEMQKDDPGAFVIEQQQQDPPPANFSNPNGQQQQNPPPAQNPFGFNFIGVRNKDK